MVTLATIEMVATLLMNCNSSVKACFMVTPCGNVYVYYRSVIGLFCVGTKVRK